MNRRTLAAALVFAAGLVFAPAARAAVDAFIWFEDGNIRGDSTDTQHPGWIEVGSFQLEQVRAAANTIGSATSGAGAGKVSMQDLTVTKSTDSASPKLFLACANGTHFAKVKLSVRKAGGTQQEYLVLDMQNVYITSFKIAGSGAEGGALNESFKLNFSNASFESPARPGAQMVHPAAALAGVVATPTPTPRTISAGAQAAPVGATKR